MVRHHSFQALAGLVLTVVIPAQAPTGTDTLRTPPTHVLEVQRVLAESGAGLYGRGRDYVVEFDAHATRYRPIAGSDAPQETPLWLALQSVTRGSVTGWTRGAVPSHSHADHRVTYSHSAGSLGRIEERYEVRADGLALSVMLPEPVRGTGDLRVRMRLDTTLRAAIGRHPAGLTLHGCPTGEVTVGAVTGIDADGARCAGWLEHDGDSLDLVLPGDWVAAAAWPILVDPLISFERNISTSGSDYAPDVTAVPARGEYLVVFETRTSAITGDIWAVSVDANTGQTAGSFRVSIPGPWSQSPVVTHAGDGSGGRIYIAWHEFANLTTGSEQLVVLDAASYSEVARTQVGATRPNQSALPSLDIGSVPSNPTAGYTGPGALLVVALPGTGIDLFRFDDIQLGASANQPTAAQVESLTVTKTGGGAGRFMLAWAQPQSGVRFTYFMSCERDLTRGLPTAVNGSPFTDHIEPAIASDGTNATIVLTAADANTGEFKLYTCFPPYPSGSQLRCRFVPAGGPGDDIRRPTVTCFGNDFYGMAWADRTSFGSDYQLAGINVRHLEPTACGRRFDVITGTAHTVGLVRSGSMFEAGGLGDQAMVCFEDHNLANGSHDIYVQRIEALGSGGQVTNLGGSCEQGGAIATAGGTASLGNPNFALALSGAGRYGDTSATLMVGFGSQPILFHCGLGCTALLGEVFLGLGMTSGGGISAPLPIPCDPAFYGGTVNAQFWTYLPIGLSCGLVPFAFSDILQFTLGD
ncbi:MAG: hypothetical protein IPM29_25285 [Planctomycetes bacterium]|nr:hypothetical protein [Planctomycetota bacterium]